MIDHWNPESNAGHLWLCCPNTITEESARDKDYNAEKSNALEEMESRLVQETLLNSELLFLLWVKEDEAVQLAFS